MCHGGGAGGTGGGRSGQATKAAPDLPASGELGARESPQTFYWGVPSSNGSQFQPCWGSTRGVLSPPGEPPPAASAPGDLHTPGPSMRQRGPPSPVGHLPMTRPIIPSLWHPLHTGIPPPPALFPALSVLLLGVGGETRVGGKKGNGMGGKGGEGKQRKKRRKRGKWGR